LVEAACAIRGLFPVPSWRHSFPSSKSFTDALHSRQPTNKRMYKDFS
jgi:hypothetical protein